MNTCKETEEQSTVSFKSLGLQKTFLKNVEKKGYKRPTDIQVQAIPAVLTGKDLIAIAQTGTGKTAAFALPILQRAMQSEADETTKILVIAPTRELAFQIHDEIQGFTFQTGLKSVCLVGGVPILRHIKRLKKPSDIIVACPGRLLDLVKRKVINLSCVEAFVLDEADQMFDMGFLPDVKRIVSYLPKERQTLLFSATMPDEIRVLAQDITKNPQNISIKANEIPVKIDQQVLKVAEHSKRQLLARLYKTLDKGSVLIFTRTKRRAMALSDHLNKDGVPALSLQGNLSQNRRKAAIDNFKKGKVKVLVATDIAARGIDVPLVSHVINFDIPLTAEAYTHRIGRTGRASREGNAYTFVTRSDLKALRSIEIHTGTDLSPEQLDEFDFDDGGNHTPQRRHRQGPRNDSFKKKGSFQKKRYGRRKDARGDRRSRASA